MSNYKQADTKTQWFENKYPGSKMNLKPSNMVVVLHTTEGTSWPDYSGGSTAPTYTGMPPLGKEKGKWRAHFPDESSARALRNNPGGVETNTLNCVQLELIGTCDPKHRERWNGNSTQYLAGRDYVYWPNADEKQLKWVARILADFHVRHGFQLVSKKRFLPYPSSYGSSPVRLSNFLWLRSVGVYGHQHVPENSHGDPGNIRIDFILRWARKFAEQRKAGE